LQAVAGNDAVDATGADGMAELTKFLGDDGGGGIGVEEAISDDQADDFVGATVEGLRTALMILQYGRAVLVIPPAQLEVALLAVPISAGGLQGAEVAFALDEHKELTGNGIVGADGQRAAWADQALGGPVYRKHRRLLSLDEFGGKLGRRGMKSLVKYESKNDSAIDHA